MPSVASDFFDAGERVDDLIDDLEDGIDESTESGMETAAREVRRRVDDNDSIATGTLYGALAEEPTEQPTGGGIVAHQTIEIPDQYKPLEYGTGRYGPYPAPDPKPPLEDILTWVVAKGITPRSSGPYETQIGLAKAIQETIGMMGNRPHPFARPGWYGPRGREHVKREIASGMSRAVRRNDLS